VTECERGVYIVTDPKDRLPRATHIVDVGSPYATAADGEFRDLDFDDGAAELYHRPGSTGAMFAHFGGEDIVAVLYDFLKRSRGPVAFWLEDAPCGAVGHASDLSEMHPGLIATVDPRVVASPAALSSTIRGESD
jgi:hypothetical protein